MKSGINISNPVSVANFAKACGVSRQTIYTGIENGDIVRRESDNKIDTENITNKQYLANRKGGTGQKQKPGPELKEKIEQAELNLDLGKLEDIQAYIDFSNAPKSTVDKYRSLEAAMTIKFNREKDRGLYVRRDFTTRIIQKIYALDTESLKALPDRATDELGAIFKSEDTEELLLCNEFLTNEIYTILDGVKKELDKFITEMD